MNTMTKLAGIALSISLATTSMLGCTAETAESTDAQPEISTLSASAGTRASLGIATWETYENNGGRWIVARDEQGSTLATLKAEAQGEDTMHFTSFPQNETVTLRRDGNLEGSASHERLGAMVTALHADAEARPFIPAVSEVKASSEGEAIGSASQALTILAWQNDVKRVGGLFGFRDTFTIGSDCPEGTYRWYYDVWLLTGSANYYIQDWSSNDPTDCHVILHMGIGAFGNATVHALAYDLH